MKKMSLAIVMLLALGLVFTSCKQQDADLTADDLKDTSWMIGTWERKSEVDYKITGADEAVEKLIKKQYEALPDTTTIVVTEYDVNSYAAQLRIYILSAGKEVNVPGVGKSKVSVKINKAKTKVSIYTDTEVSKTIAGKEISIKVSRTTTYTKK